MKNYEEENDECHCLKCELEKDFELMIQDGVDWKSALRHVLDVATTTSDETVADMMDEAFREGMVEATRETAEMLIDIADRLEGVNIADINSDKEITIEDLSDEEYEEVQSILRKQIENN